MRRDNRLSGTGTDPVARIRGRKRKHRQQARIGAPDAASTANAGLAAISELCDRLGVIEALDAAVGPIKRRDRGFGAGQLLALDRGGAAGRGRTSWLGWTASALMRPGQQLTPVPGLSSTTAAGLARRIRPEQWQAVERGVAAVTERMLVLLPAGLGRGAGRRSGSRSTWDTPPTWEVYGA